MFKFFERKKIESSILTVLLVLSIIGLAVLASAYIGQKVINPELSILQPLSIQLIAFFVGTIFLLAARFFPYQKYNKGKYVLFFITLSVFFILLLTTDLSIDRNGVVRWLDFGYFTFQPSELLKLATVLGYAYLFSSDLRQKSPMWFYLLTIGGMIFLFTVSYAQPNYGTFLILGIVFLSMAFIAKLSKWLWYTLIIVTIIATSVAPFVLPSYVLDRFSTSYKLVTDQLSYDERYGVAYQALQNLETVTNGGIAGRGVGYSLQKLGALPETTTDSIFALAAEELGFIGSSFIVILFLLLIIMGFTIAQRTKDVFGKLLAVGITTLIGTGAFLNILIVLGAPTTGIPLLLFSKSGTSILITLLGIGILLNIARQQRVQRTKLAL